MPRTRQNSDSELLKEVMADAKAIREIAIENAKDVLEEAFTPRLQSMISATIQQEMEGEDEEGEDEDLDSLELDLDSDESEESDDEEEELDDEEEESLEDLLGDLGDETEDSDEEEEVESEESDDEDEEDVDIEEIVSFLEAMSDDDRHASPNTADRSSDATQMHHDETLLDLDLEDDETSNSGAVLDEDVYAILRELEDEAEEEFEDDDVIERFIRSLSENDQFAAGDEEDMDDYYGDENQSDVYMDESDLLDDTEWDEDDLDLDEVIRMLEMEDEDDEDETVYEVNLNEFGSGTVQQPIRGNEVELSEPYDVHLDDLLDGGGLDVSSDEYELDESLTFESLLKEIEDEVEEDEDLQTENAQLRQQLNKHRQAIKILRNQINEVNLINSKLLYTNRLFKRHDMNNSQKMRVIEAFDRTKNLREAKIVYSTLAEAFSLNKDSLNEGSSNNRSKKRLAESIARGMGSAKTKGTKPNNDKKILSEDVEFKSRWQKLANINND